MIHGIDFWIVLLKLNHNLSSWLKALLGCWILETGSLHDSRISSSSQMHSLVTGLWLSVDSTAEITSNTFLPANRASMGLFSSVGPFRFCCSKVDQLQPAQDRAASAQAKEEGRKRDGAEGGIPELTLKLQLLLVEAGARNNWRNEKWQYLFL